MPPRHFAIALSYLAAIVLACDHKPRQEPEPGSLKSANSDGWLRGSVDERFAQVSRHLRGFDMAMVEVGYRYSELYWAARDGNWGYAEYQLGKLETAIENGVERRPARAASARMLEGAVSVVRRAVEGRDDDAMEQALTTLTSTCNACHEAERVPFATVAPPSVRLSPVQFPPNTPKAPSP